MIIRAFQEISEDEEYCYIIEYSTPTLTSASDPPSAMTRSPFNFHDINVLADILGVKLSLVSYLAQSPPRTPRSQQQLQQPQSNQPFYSENGIVEYGPKLNFVTSWCSNALSILHRAGMTKITRIEKSHRVRGDEPTIDKMTQQIYDSKIQEMMSFDDYLLPLHLSTTSTPETKEIPLVSLPEYNKKMGLALDDNDLLYYLRLYTEIGRDPTDVEIFDLAQSNSEHSRHWFFRGRLLVNGAERPHTLMQLIKAPLEQQHIKLTKQGRTPRSLVAFSDNSSAIDGFDVPHLYVDSQTGQYTNKTIHKDLVFTAETHNFPTGIAPFPGAATGVGGRIRDSIAIGKGADIIAGTAGYCVGNINEEDGEDVKRGNHKPSHILVEASNGASDYGNKIGEPIILGFTRSFGKELYPNSLKPEASRREWIKPIMFSGGIGQMNRCHLEKCKPEEGWLVVKVGGPAYRIGMGGGAASSRQQETTLVITNESSELITTSTTSTDDLDFSAVQRGDPEMENRVVRFVRSCTDLLENCPILSVHDQGAGGTANVTKEIVSPLGAQINLRSIISGDKSLSPVELWVAEYQEQISILIDPKDSKLVSKIAKREHVPIAFIGFITGTERIEVFDSKYSDSATLTDKKYLEKPVDLDLKLVLEDVPQKKFRLTSNRPPIVQIQEQQLRRIHQLNQVNQQLNQQLRQQLNKSSPRTSFTNLLNKVLKNLDVCSKRFLTVKVDRSVSGLIAQQQCVGPLDTPLSDYALVAQSYFPNDQLKYTGIASSIGERPILELIGEGSEGPVAMAQMAVGEMLTNLMFCQVTSLEDITCAGNWMWPSKTGHDGYRLLRAAETLSELLIELGIAIDGGKDSMSMKATDNSIPSKPTIKSPSSLVISSYAPCPDIRCKVTPDFKEAGNSILFVDLSDRKYPMGGTIATAELSIEYNNNTNSSVPFMAVTDLPSIQVDKLKNTFTIVQYLLKNKLLVSGHDRSDGGLITTVAEMCFAGNLGCELSINNRDYDLINPIDPIDPIDYFFTEELGLVLEVTPGNTEKVQKMLNEVAHCTVIGKVTFSDNITITYNQYPLLNELMTQLRDTWESTSFRLDKLQANPECVRKEQEIHKERIHHQPYTVPDQVWERLRQISQASNDTTNKVHVAIIREQGSNGDREMAGALYAAGFTVTDICTSDLINNKYNLSQFQGLIFVGGFSFSDVFGAGRGWYTALTRNTRIKTQLDEFRARPDTFSLGVCNGCQLMSLLGWVPNCKFTQNDSKRFESRFSRVKIQPSNSIMLQGLEGSELGVWVAHGEGKYSATTSKEVSEISSEVSQEVITFVDDQGNLADSENYPFNPNGSQNGTTGVCSQDGRHLAMMPHVERTFLQWQMPWKPNDWDRDVYSPWFLLFKNAYDWCNVE